MPFQVRWGKFRVPLAGGPPHGPALPLNSSSTPLPRASELLFSLPPRCAKSLNTPAVAALADGYTGHQLGPLIVSARKADEDTDKTYLHRGIATRAFERRFHLADHVQVTGAAQADGMLHIDLERQVPEALKPRQIQIARAPKAIEKDVVDANTVN